MAALGRRASQPVTEFFKPLPQRENFFVPVSKRERSSEESSGAGAATPEKASIGTEGGVKKRGKPRKSSLESEGNALDGSPSREADDIRRSRRGRPPQPLLDDPQSVTLPGILQDGSKLKLGRPRTRSMPNESTLGDAAKSPGSLEGARTSSGQSPHESHVCTGTVATQQVNKREMLSDGQPAVASLMQNDTDNQEEKTQDQENKRVAPGSGLADQRLSLVTPCDDFFMPVSKRRKRKEELTEKKSDEIGKVQPKPKSPAEKSSAEVPMLHTVLGKEKKSAPASASSKETAASIPGGALVREELGLRLEAVLAAQENARLNAGKAPHPFFARKKISSLKTALSWDEVSTYQVEDLQPGPPIHITQLLEDERTEFVWPEWKVRSTSGDEDPKLDFSKLERKRCRLVRLSVPFVRAELDQNPDSHSFPSKDSKLPSSPAVNGVERRSNADKTTFFLKAVQDLLQHMQTLKMTTEVVGELSVSPEFCQQVDADLSFENLKNRLSWYSARHEALHSAENVTMSQVSKESEEEVVLSSRNVLWTDLYQPRSSKEVCGNATAVESLNTWLSNWKLKITGQLVRGEDDTKGIKRDRTDDNDSDRGWFEGDSDYDSDIDNDVGLQNTLLVTGPEGCGKSAAVYACAREQGFTVIEVNASDCRNGAIIKQKFGEAMGSHGLAKGSQACVESPNKAQKERLVLSDESQMDSQITRNTVILFEDVDKQFDEDKGFLTALVQLSKTTKRPIMLTSNRSEPRLPPALEKYRIDFSNSTSEELLLHTSLVAVAEGVPFCPWLLERLVDACHRDLRKVMMALQFWGQGKVKSVSCRPQGLVNIPIHLENQQFNGHFASNNLSLEQKKSLKLNRSPKLALSHTQGQGCFDHWESDARWLFELDVHHLILPKVVSGSFECPFTLLVGEKISTAVKELEEHMEWVAASESEHRARAKQAEYEEMELERKASKKEKDALRRASHCSPGVLGDGGMRSLSLDEDEELENHCGENCARSPVKSLREAKTLARSPLKPRKLKLRRALLLCDSDDEEQRPHEQTERSGEASNRSISNAETHLPGVQNMIANSLHSNADVVSENVDDTDVIHISSSEVVVTVRRRRLSKKDSTLGTGVANCKSFSSEVSPRILVDDGERPLLVADVNERVTKDIESLILIGCETAESPQIEGQHSTQNFGSDEESQVLSNLLSGDELFLENTSIDTIALERPAFVEESNHENGLMSNHGLQSCFREVLQDTKHDLQAFEGMVPPVDLSEGLLGSVPDVSEASKQTGVGISLSTGLDEQKDAEESVPPVFEPVSDAWASLRKSQQTPNSLLEHIETSADVAASLADLLDIVSASDVISCVKPEEVKDAIRNFDGIFSEEFEGNVGHCSDWDNSQEIASQLVCTGLQVSLPFLPAINHADDRLPVLSCVLECAKDAPAVGKCMVTHFGLTGGSHQASNFYGMLDNISAKLGLKRQAQRKSRLEDMVEDAVFPRGRVSGSGFVETAAYLSRITKLEEIRRTTGIVQGRRPRRFEHYLTSKLKSFSNTDALDLLKYGTFRSS